LSPLAATSGYLFCMSICLNAYVWNLTLDLHD
jgi:hypothetical protein